MYADEMTTHRMTPCWMKNLAFHKGQKQDVEKEPGIGNEVLLSGAIPKMDALSVLYIYHYTLLRINVGINFNGCDSALLFPVHFEKLSYT